jgi:DNA-binding response OmpR family regulator
MERNILFVNCTGTLSSSLEAMKKEGFRVDTVQDSDAAIRRLKHQEYDVIILQVSPLIESWRFCSDVRRISNIPLIVISNNAITEVCVKAINAGADFFLRKHTGPQELIARIRALIYRNDLQTRRQVVPTS